MFVTLLAASYSFIWILLWISMAKILNLLTMYNEVTSIFKSYPKVAIGR